MRRPDRRGKQRGRVVSAAPRRGWWLCAPALRRRWRQPGLAAGPFPSHSPSAPPRRRAGKEQKAEKLEAAKEAIAKKREALQAAKPILPRVKFAQELKKLKAKLADLAKIETSRQLQTLETLKKLREKPELEQLVKDIEVCFCGVFFSFLSFHFRLRLRRRMFYTRERGPAAARRALPAARALWRGAHGGLPPRRGCVRSDGRHCPSPPRQDANRGWFEDEEVFQRKMKGALSAVAAAAPVKAGGAGGAGGGAGGFSAPAGGRR